MVCLFCRYLFLPSGLVQVFPRHRQNTVQTTVFEDAETVSDSFEADTEKDSDCIEAGTDNVNSLVRSQEFG